MWQFEVTAHDTAARIVNPIVVFVMGCMVGLVIAGVTYLFFSRRMKRIATAYEGEVKRTKDELLILVLHQLHTPASGVKQYLGMLTSGIFGKLLSDQQTIAEKAYEANERQLQIINELLYVSKADVGQLVVESKELTLPA